MSKLAALKPPSLDSVSLELVAPSTLRVSGTIAVRDPATHVGKFFEQVHKGAIEDGLREVKVDISKLTFVNSSAIRIFLDWASWLGAVEPAKRYKLEFLTSKNVTWQRTAFPTIVMLTRNMVTVRDID